MDSRVHFCLQRVVFIGMLTLLTSGGSGLRAGSIIDGEQSIALAELRVDRRTGQRTFAGKPFTGVATSRHRNAQRAVAERFVDGRREGVLSRWFDNGQLAFSSVYVDGHREGLTASWWSNGNKRSETHYQNDKPDGVAWRWYRGGEPFKRLQFVAGEPAGLQQGWRLNGKLFGNFEYKNGRIYGLKNANLCVELDDEALVLEDASNGNLVSVDRRGR